MQEIGNFNRETTTNSSKDPNIVSKFENNIQPNYSKTTTYIYDPLTNSTKELAKDISERSDYSSSQTQINKPLSSETIINKNSNALQSSSQINNSLGSNIKGSNPLNDQQNETSLLNQLGNTASGQSNTFEKTSDLTGFQPTFVDVETKREDIDSIKLTFVKDQPIDNGAPDLLEEKEIHIIAEKSKTTTIVKTNETGQSL